MTLILQGINIHKRFGGVIALEGVSFTVNEGEILGIIGPNGSGKTTLFNVITGFEKPNSGKVLFKGRDITGLPPHEIFKLGIARTFQIPRPFKKMTVIENVMFGVVFRRKKGLKVAREEALRILELFGLKNKAHEKAENLQLQQERLLEIARALAAEPDIILLDEIVSGLNPTEVLQLVKLIKRIRDEFKVTICWVEHVMRAIMTGCERIIVLASGKKIAEGSPREVAMNEKVIQAYLGERYVV
jgi:branched-chain amino acid transport system ATP-binding protein